ncbi:MAG: aldehyde dehydrogenase family protein, partial [Myxococcota bacterium]
ELGGFEDRARTMMRLAPEALAPLDPGPKEGFRRSIRREPLGLVLVLAPWNYPWLTAVNAIVPALLAGNTVLLKHSDQTPLVAERMSEAAKEAGLPPGVFAHVHASHVMVAHMVADPRVAFVAFTGSVAGGHAVQRAASERFVGINLELGGKDAAYVREDADLAQAIATTAEGAFYNAGQSCCGIERIYVHRDRYEAFVEGFVAEARRLVLGDPRDAATTLGPLVRVRNAEAVLRHVDAAIAAGARAHLGADEFPEAAARGLPYLAPQVLTEVDEGMELMREETFGPVVGIAPVADDAEAVRRIDASRYGLTAALFTRDLERAEALAAELEVGTVFANRCDYLDPELAWVGVKDSGRGVSLSRVAFEALTRPKSLHFRVL